MINSKEVETRDIGLAGIAVLPDRLRPLRPEIVKELASSMRKQGLLQPIVIRRKPGTGYYLVAGLHRYHAAKKLGWQAIRAQIFPSWGEAEALLAEIDENLIRADLTPSQRAKFTAARKKAYVAAHPQTKAGGAPGKAGGGKVAAAKSAKLASFVDDTAAKTGQSKRAVARDVARAEALGDDIDRVAKTSLDKGVELDALAKMPADDRAPLIARAAAGEKISAQRPVASAVPNVPDIDAIEASVKSGGYVCDDCLDKAQTTDPDRVKRIVLHKAIRDILDATAKIAPEKAAADPRSSIDDRNETLNELAIIQHWLSQFSAALVQASETAEGEAPPVGRTERWAIRHCFARALMVTVHAFPTAHTGIADTIGRRMAATASIDDAEAELIAHLEIHWDFLEAAGVDCDEIEVECRQFAIAAWQRFQQLRQGAGAA